MTERKCCDCQCEDDLQHVIGNAGAFQLDLSISPVNSSPVVDHMCGTPTREQIRLLAVATGYCRTIGCTSYSGILHYVGDETNYPTWQGFVTLGCTGERFHATLRCECNMAEATHWRCFIEFESGCIPPVWVPLPSTLEANPCCGNWLPTWCNLSGTIYATIISNSETCDGDFHGTVIPFVESNAHPGTFYGKLKVCEGTTLRWKAYAERKPIMTQPLSLSQDHRSDNYVHHIETSILDNCWSPPTFIAWPECGGINYTWMNCNPLKECGQLLFPQDTCGNHRPRNYLVVWSR